MTLKNGFHKCPLVVWKVKTSKACFEIPTLNTPGKRLVLFSSFVFLLLLLSSHLHVIILRSYMYHNLCILNGFSNFPESSRYPDSTENVTWVSSPSAHTVKYNNHLNLPKILPVWIICHYWRNYSRSDRIGPLGPADSEMRKQYCVWT